MRFVFLRYREQDVDAITCILLRDDQASQCVENPQQYVKRVFDGGEFVDFWEVPQVLDNISASGDIRHVFGAVVGLDAISDSPVVTDLLSTIFEAGYQLAAYRSPVTHKP